MICKSCGGQIDENALQCPYCGEENPIVAEREQRRAVDEYKEKEQELEKLPDKVGKKVSNGVLKWLIIAFIGFAVFAVLLAGIVALVNHVKASKKEKIVTKLESLYQSGDYVEMADYLDKQDYETEYRKYNNIADLVNDYQLYLEFYADDGKDAVSNNNSGILEPGIKDLLDILADVKELEKEGYLYEEEAGVKYYYDTAYSELKEKYLLTDEEINEGMLNFEDSSKIGELGEVSYERMREKT